jgi:PQQ-dependent catabolism-associated CXXCW motif protein
VSKRRGRYIFFFEITIWVVIIVAAIVGVTISQAGESAAEAAAPEPEGYWTGAINGAVPATIRGGTVVNTKVLQALVKNDQLVLVDASNHPKKPDKLAPNAPWIPAPHASIPKTLWIPGSGMGEIAPDVEALYRDRLARATANDLDTPIVVYCHERCWLSYNAARRALSYGYRKVYWYPDGIEGWRAAELPTSIVEAIEAPGSPRPASPAPAPSSPRG